MRITIRFKKFIACLMALIMCLGLAVGVNAAYVTMLDYGLGYYSRVNALRWINGAGNTATNATKFVVYWALDSFDSDYTYTFTFNFSSDADINFSPKYVSGSSEGCVFLESFLIGPYYNFDNADDLDVYSSFEKVDGKYVLTVKLNPGLLNWTKFPMYVYLYYNLQSETTFTTNGWGVSAEYDPGGSKYIEDYLSDIRDQLHAGDDKLDNIPSNSDFSNSVSSIDSAEASLISASDPNGTALSDFSAKGKTTVTAVNTTYRQTFAFINSLVTKVMDDLDFGALVFLALTLGLIAYILGRVK